MISLLDALVDQVRALSHARMPTRILSSPESYRLLRAQVDAEPTDRSIMTVPIVVHPAIPHRYLAIEYSDGTIERIDGLPVKET